MSRSNKTDRAAKSDPFFDKGLPNAIEMERSILGSGLLDPLCVDQAAELLRREDFFLDSHRRIFEKMVALRAENSPVDLLTLAEALRRDGEFEQIGGATYIASLIDGVPRTDTIEPYAKKVIEKAMLRAEITAANQIIMLAFEEEDSAIEIAGKGTAMMHAIIERAASSKWEHVGDIANRKLEQIEQMAGRPEMITGIPTGFTDYDRLTSGLQKQEVTVIAARPSQGKTALALNVAQYAAKNGSVIGIFSFEMSGEQLIARLLCSEGRVDAHRLRTGYLNREEWAKLADALRRLNEQKIFIEDAAALPPSVMKAKCRQLQSEHGLDLLIVDYLQLMGSDLKTREYNRQQEVAANSAAMKTLSKELDIPVILLSQLSRAPEQRSEHEPQLSDLRESGAIEQDSDNVVFIYRAELYNPTDENQGKAKLILRKQRNGPTGDIELAWLKEYTRFENMWRE